MENKDDSNNLGGLPKTDWNSQQCNSYWTWLTVNASQLHLRELGPFFQKFQHLAECGIFIFVCDQSCRNGTCSLSNCPTNWWILHCATRSWNILQRTYGIHNLRLCSLAHLHITSRYCGSSQRLSYHWPNSIGRINKVFIQSGHTDHFLQISFWFRPKA